MSAKSKRQHVIGAVVAAAHPGDPASGDSQMYITFEAAAEARYASSPCSARSLRDGCRRKLAVNDIIRRNEISNRETVTRYGGW